MLELVLSIGSRAEEWDCGVQGVSRYAMAIQQNSSCLILRPHEVLRSSSNAGSIADEVVSKLVTN